MAAFYPTLFGRAYKIPASCALAPAQESHLRALWASSLDHAESYR